ncbi:DUF3126 family protein [Blastochloris viridis]|uniref:DUF3126 family protein n=1 Tax=Blastochloris viridis TaxID=1079 RepID=A0A182D0T5_BLAVI|nr:DUF3126 family protein [Blastochloris viridis]ALK10905.1 hypothetical protein BVIR_3147 [Blastochloris viridis]BAR99116.1 hypothetical protein BV133_1523 [Blastochloris viridis]
MDAKEISKLDRYLKRLFNNAGVKVRARPQKKDSAELYIGDEFVGVLFRDDEDGDLSYNLQIAILDSDLD